MAKVTLEQVNVHWMRGTVPLTEAKVRDAVGRLENAAALVVTEAAAKEARAIARRIGVRLTVLVDERAPAGRWGVGERMGR